MLSEKYGGRKKKNRKIWNGKMKSPVYVSTDKYAYIAATTKFWVATNTTPTLQDSLIQYYLLWLSTRKIESKQQHLIFESCASTDSWVNASGFSTIRTSGFPDIPNLPFTTHNCFLMLRLHIAIRDESEIPFQNQA